MAFGNVGAAFYIPQYSTEVSIKLNKEMSIFTAECIAIWQALMFVKTKGWNNNNFFQYSFSDLHQLSYLGPCLTEDWYSTTIKHQIRNLIAARTKMKLVLTYVTL